MSNDRSEPRTQASFTNNKEAGRTAAMKCRIPQRLGSLSGRKPTTTVSVAVARARPDPAKQKYEVPSSNNRFAAKNPPRVRSDEVRPMSAGRLKEELFPNRPANLSARFAKPHERASNTQKRPTTLLRMTENHKSGRIVVPTQGSNKIYEDLELRLSTLSDYRPESPECNDQPEGEKSLKRNDQMMQLKICWQSKIIQFEEMKHGLKDQQRKLLELYAILREIHQKLSSLGEEANLPSPEDLQIMNVAKMTPEQLLQLCGDDVIALPDNHWDGKTPLTIDMNKFYEIPTKLVHTCEQTLVKRKEIIDWFESLTKEEKGISKHKLSKNINEFNAENDMLKSSIEHAKAEFLEKLDEIVNLMRKGVKKTMALHLRTEELTYELSELNSQNMDLRKQLHSTDHLRSPPNRARVAELEKELKEEKCKKILVKDRLCRSEGQVKIHMERANQLEATLEQARSQIWTLERTVQQLNEQNQNLQSEFDQELKKLTESIRDHTMHLEEIGEAREKLQLEKQDLEKRLADLSDYYNESLTNLKEEMNVNVAKLIDIEKKYEEQGEDKKRLTRRLESLCSQLAETEIRHKVTLQQLHVMEVQLDKEKDVHTELENTKKELEKANLEIACTIDKFNQQNDAIKEFERSLKEAVDSMKALQCEMTSKDEYIANMEKKQALLEQQLEENENKMETYVEQLSSLKTHIYELQEDFGHFENLSDLHEMVNEQREKLLEATRENGDLAEALHRKEKELEQYNESLSEHKKLLLEREDVIKMLSQKEEEQTNIIKILRNNLELKSRADNDLTQQIKEKNIEIDSLFVNLETRKQQISNLEKIILTLEDQTRKASQTRKKDQDCILTLRKKLTEYEAVPVGPPQNGNTPGENLDSLIKTLEDELETSFDLELNPKDHNYSIEVKNNFMKDKNREKPETYDDPKSEPTKMVTGNFVKKTYIAGNGEQYSGDNLDRKNGITKIETQKRGSPTESGYNAPVPLSTNELSNRRFVPAPPQKSFLDRNVLLLNLDQHREDKKYKMFKIAGHRL